MTLSQKLFQELESAKQWLLSLQTKLTMPATIRKFADAIQTHEGYYKGSRSYRNNNPGNLRFTPYTKSLGASGKDAQNFCIFPSYVVGFAALCTFLKDACSDKLRAYKGTMTLYQFFSVYAPAADQNNPNRYAEFVAGYIRIPPDTQIKSFL